MGADPDAVLAFMIVAGGLWGVMALGYPAPVGFLVAYAGLALLALDVFPAELLVAPPITSFWALGTVATVALLGRLLVPRLLSLRRSGSLLAPFAPAVTGAAAAFAFDDTTETDEESGGLRGAVDNSIAGISPLGIPLIAAAFMMNVSILQLVVAAILPALALCLAGSALLGNRQDTSGVLPLAGITSEIVWPAVALAAFALIIAGIATSAEAFALGALVLLGIGLRRDGLAETTTLFGAALPDVARVVLLLLAAIPVAILLPRIVSPVWMAELWSLAPAICFLVSLLFAAAFGLVGGSLVSMLAMTLLFAPAASTSIVVMPAQFVLAWLLAAEAGRFLSARWRGGLEGTDVVWLFVLAAAAGVAMATDAWVVSI